MSDLPLRPSLTSLRKQAKSLLSGFRKGDLDAISTVQEHHPKPEQFYSLRDAQLVIARQYEHSGWQELCRAVESAVDAALSLDDRVSLFSDLACLCYSGDESVHRRERAARLLEETPELTSASVYAAAAAADIDALRVHLERDASLANKVGGPRDWAPLMYVTYSRLPELSGDVVSAIRLLLDANADPRFYVEGSKGWGGWRWTALTGAIGEGESGDVQQSPHPLAREIAVLLLDAGADPNDSQALYNCHFTPGTEWLELLLSYGLDESAPTNPDEPHEETTLNYQLAAAVRTGNAECVRILLEHGADASGRDPRYTQQTYVENVVAAGYGDILDLLVEHGARSPELSSSDQFRFAVVAGDEAEARRLLAEDTSVIDQPNLMVDLACRNRLEAAKLLLDLGANPNRMNINGRGALHEAAWYGLQEMTELLLAGGAGLDVRSEAHDGTAVGYANHAGRFELRDFLLEQSRDVFDLIRFDRVDRLKDVLAEEPELAKATPHGGRTALHNVKEGSGREAEVIDVLLENGIDINVKSEDGKTPLAVAVSAEQDTVAELLRARGGTE